MCGLHPLNCGSLLQVGTLLKLRKATIQVPTETKIAVERPNGTREFRSELVLSDVATIKAFVWINGVESCCVGFVSSAFQSIYGDALDGRIIDVRSLLDESDSESERLRSKENNGMIQCIIIG